MNSRTFDRTSLRLSATLLLAGQLLYVLVTLSDAGGDANNHSAVFAAYAASGMWTAVHVARFACMALILAGFLALFFALDAQLGMTRWATRFGAASRVRVPLAQQQRPLPAISPSRTRTLIPKAPISLKTSLEVCSTN